MVFSSVPVYLDPPNWHHHLQQQPNLEQENVAGNNHPQHQLPPLPPPSYGGGGGGGSGGSIKPGSMSDRARLAKIPQPETALKCPRCESTNTKFCYFNNYSLSQPRHFCKTCRRYWTRGGALRNVPVGGGCRRNKKSKSKNSTTNTSSSSKSQATTTTTATTTITSSSTLAPPHHMLMGHHNFPQQPLQLPFLSSLQNLTQFNQAAQMDSVLSANHQWSTTMQQLPFLAGQGFDSANQLFSFHGGGGGEAVAVTTSSVAPLMMGSRVSDQAVKAEEKQARTFLGISENNNNSNNNDGFYTAHAWGGGGNIWSHGNEATDDHQLSSGQQLTNSSAVATTRFL